MLFVAATFIISLVLGLMIIPNVLLISYKKRLFDMPDARKVHTAPIPRLGGVSFYPVILISLCGTIGLCYFLSQPLIGAHPNQTLYEFLFFAVGCMLLYLVGVADDMIGISYRQKFFVQIIAALLLVLGGDWLNSLDGILGIYAIPAWAGIPLTLFVVVYITNAINLIDGIDGLASGLSCIALAAFAILFALSRQYIYTMVALATIGVLIPFWFYNVFGNAMRGHKLFMGDTGSLTVGYILSFLVINLSRSDADSTGATASDMVVAFSTLIIPLFDVVRVVIHRLHVGHNPFLPDKNHIHHKLQRTGLRIRMILLTLLLLCIFFIGVNVLLVNRLDATWILAIDVALWLAMHLVINAFIRRHDARLAAQAVNTSEGGDDATCPERD